MSTEAIPDLSGLAIVAQTRTTDLKPLLLKVHAKAFAAIREHDAAGLATFETLALGLLPFASPAVAAEVLHVLRGAHGVPILVTVGLEERAAGAEPRDGGSYSAQDTHRLVEGARLRPALARDLLSRPEVSVFERARLYRFADPSGRDGLRRELAARLSLAPARRRLPEADRRLIAVVAEAAGFAAATAQVARHLHCGDVPDWKAHRGSDAEFFALALVALGLDDAECVRVLLTVDPAISHSVGLVFRLTAVIRATAPTVAAFLLASELDAPDASSRAAGPSEEPGGRGRIVLEGRRASVAGAIVSVAREPSRSATGRIGYRSQSTTGRGRS